MTTQIGALSVTLGADVTGFLDQMGKAEKALLTLNPTINAVVKSTTQLAGAAAVAGGAIFVFAKRAADTADEAGKMAQKVGLTAESFSALKYAATIADVSTESLGIGLKQLSKHMQEAQQGAGDAYQAFRALGISAIDTATKQLRPTEDVLLDLAERFARMEDGAGKTALALRYFGKSGSDLIPFLNQGREGIRQLMEEARKLGIVISTEAAKQAEEFNDNLRRLKASSEGLALQLAGPLVEALGKATGAMVKAGLEGETAGAKIRAGIRMLLTGDDAYKFNKQFFEATEALFQAQNNLDRARSDTYANWISGGKNVEQALAKVAAAQAEVNRLQTIKPVLLGEDPKAPPKKEEAPRVVSKEEADAELKAYVDGVRMAEEDAAEARRLGTDFLQAERDKQLTIERQVLADQLAAIDAQQAAEIAAAEKSGEAAGLSSTAKMVVLRHMYGDQTVLENEAYARRLEDLQNYSDAELEAIGGRHTAEQQLEAQHWDNLRQIRTQNLSQLADFSRASWDEQTAHMIGAMAEMTAGAAQHNKAMFEINKAASIANAIVKGWEAIQNSFEFGTEFGGPIAGYAMAGLAAAATAININAIRNTSFGGGGATPTFSASPATGLPAEAAPAKGSDRNLQTTIINLPGTDVVSTKVVRELLVKIDQHNRNGGRVVVE